MFKKLMACLLAFILVFSVSALTSCSDDEADGADETTAEGVSDSSDASGSQDEATEPVEDTTAAPRDTYKYVDLYDEIGVDHSPYSMVAEGSSIGVRFTVEAGFVEEIAVNCPSWSDDLGNLTFRVYKWDTDYATTVAGTPAYEEEFVDYPDNNANTIYLPATAEEGTMISAGEWLFTISDAVNTGDSGVGIWAYGPYSGDDLEFYVNGAVSETFSMDGSMVIRIPAEA